MDKEQIAYGALGIPWESTEAQARCVALHAAKLLGQADADRRKLWDIISAVECNYPRVESLSDDEAREVLLSLCRTVLEKRDRGTGRTTAQMIAAPTNAAYVWPVSRSVVYAKDLARSLGREDLKVVDRSWLSGPESRGWRNAVIVDHAVEALDDSELIALDRIISRMMSVGR